MSIGLVSLRNRIEPFAVGTATGALVVERHKLTIQRPGHARGEPRTRKVFASLQGAFCGFGLDQVIVQYDLLSLSLLFAIASEIALDLTLVSQAAIALSVQRRDALLDLVLLS